MAHDIDQTTGRAAIAFTGEPPWHHLGQPLPKGASIEVWREAARLNYSVERSPVQFQSSQGSQDFKGRDVLYRSDTGAALSVVSKSYKVVQPDEILDFFNKLSQIGGFELEVAGALSGGKRVWGLAKVGEGASIVGQDVVRPYVLFATSYDGTMATIAKFTAIRVVCNNTITMAVGRGAYGLGKTEQDTENRAVSTLVRIPHSQKLDDHDIRLQLGIVEDVYDRWLVNTRVLVEKTMDEAQANQFVFDLVDHFTPKSANKTTVIEKSKAYTRMMALFNGGQKGANLAGTHNRWAMLNAVTQFVDYERGHHPDSRLSGAWFGTGEAMKTKAYHKLMAL